MNWTPEPKSPRRRRGRPKLDAAASLGASVTIRVRADEREGIEQAARAWGQPVSTYAREALAAGQALLNGDGPGLAAELIDRWHAHGIGRTVWMEVAGKQVAIFVLEKAS